jgi:hypothetical protein
VVRKRFVILAVALVALNTFFWLVQGGFALPQSLISEFFGARMVRSEVLVQAPNGTTEDYRLDQGIIVGLSSGSVTLRERNGDVVPIPVDPGAQVRIGTQILTPTALRRRMRIVTIRVANAPATSIQVLGY